MKFKTSAELAEFLKANPDYRGRFLSRNHLRHQEFDSIGVWLEDGELVHWHPTQPGTTLAPKTARYEAYKD